MSETQNVDTETPVAVTPVTETPVAIKKPLNLALIVALGALALSGWQVFATQQQLARARFELSRHNPDAAIKTLSEQLRASDARQVLLEAKLGQSAGQLATLNTIYQDMTKDRSDWLLSEVSHTLALSSQELQLAGNVPSAISALQVVNDRLARFDRPELIGVKAAVARDLEKLRALPYLDTIGLSAKIDSLTQNIDNLPLVVDIQRQAVAPVATHGTGSMWVQLMRDISQSLGEMVRIRRIDKPEAVLLSPEQSFLLRENLKLRLLDARIALLQRNASPYSADITAVQSYATRYFDVSAPATQQWLAELKELKAAPINNALPDLSDSLKAINSAQSAPGA